MKGIVWLASYPKSGNTWLRIFLANYLASADAPISINDVPFPPIASSRQHLANELALDASDFSPAEIDALRPSAYRTLAARATDVPYVKIHDANVALPGGERLVPADATDRAVYLLRDPRDVAVSLARHAGITVDAAIAAMADPAYAYVSDARTPGDQLTQRLLTWRAHVLSWSDEASFPVHVVRYEDLIADPADAFGSILRFVGITLDAARLEQAIRFSAVDELRRQEATHGFREASAYAERFFDRGRAGLWRDELSAEQADRVHADHTDVMQRYAYA